MSSPLDWSLIDGPVPVLFAAATFVVLAVLLWVRRRTWWTRAVPLCLAISGVTVAVVWLLFHEEWRPFPKYLYVWIGLTVLILALVVARMRLARWPGRVLMVFGVVFAVVTTGAQVNACYGMFTSTRVLLASMFDSPVDIASLPGKDNPVVRSPAGKPLDEVWQAPSDLHAMGTVATVKIPSSGGFDPRDAWLYLPPAYSSTPRAELPVIVMLVGDPGRMRDWVDGGHINATLDAYAREHKGLAPIVVMADVMGTGSTYPMCLDSKIGKVATYLSRDVPNWVKQNLQVTSDHRRWAIGGLSSGGTCALQMAVNAPEVYPTFMDMSGQREPNIGTRKYTVDTAFGGNTDAFTAVNPLDVLARTRFPTTSGVIAVGSEDAEFAPQQRAVFTACKAAGMDVRWSVVPGAHSWIVWRAVFEQSVPWLAKRMELTR